MVHVVCHDEPRYGCLDISAIASRIIIKLAIKVGNPLLSHFSHIRSLKRRHILSVGID
jgi:hypothetical protein